MDELEDAVLGILAQSAAEVLDVELHAGSEGDACVGVWIGLRIPSGRGSGGVAVWAGDLGE